MYTFQSAISQAQSNDFFDDVFISDVYTAELILTGVLTQTLDYESYPFKMHARFNRHMKQSLLNDF